MSKATYPLKLPRSVKDAAAKLAREDGVSLNQWIASAVSQKIGAVETAARFLENRKGSATGEGFADFLVRVPNAAPEPGDAMPGRNRPVP